ncbi:MAG: hypothetical protein ACOYM3_28340 [Terrimicrobiaceae bacterium]
MNTILPIAWIVVLGLAPLSKAETNPRQIKAEEIVSLQRIAMLFDGGSIQFRFEMSSGSPLELILNDHEQMGLLRGVPEESAKDWWLWLVKDHENYFLYPDKPENQAILNMLAAFLKRHSDIDSHADQNLLELMAILKDRRRTKVSYDTWTYFKNDIAK